ncbi:MAG: MBL fold metallo-hydrolase, partial [Micromonosporaceae bacterium]
THVHRDHYTQAVAIRREVGSTVSLGIGEKPALDAIADAALTRDNPQLQMLRRAGAHGLVTQLRELSDANTPDLTNWEQPDEWLTEDTTLAVPGRELQVVPTPGHTQGHVVFADQDNQLLFAGDHVLPHITPSIGFELVPGEQPLGDFLRSLARVRAMPDLRLLPAHGQVAPSVHARVDELTAHHEHRLEQCRDAVEAGADTGHGAAEALPWTRRQRRFADLDLFNQMLAIIETVAHLDLLVARGSLRAETHDGVRHYLPPPEAPAAGA